MKINKLLTLFTLAFTLLLSSSAHAQRAKVLSKKQKAQQRVKIQKQNEEFEKDRLFKTADPNSLKSSEIKEYEDIYLYENSLLLESSKDGLYADDFYTGKDNNRFFMSYQFSSNYEETNAVTSLELGYQRKMKNFKDTWFTITLKRTIAEFDEISDESTSTGTNADGNTIRFSAEQSFTTVGMGAGYRFRALSDFTKNDRFFETCFAVLNYSTHLDNATGKKYNGFGMNMDYGLHYRASNTFYYGGKLSYNIMPMVREPEDDEKRQQRSLVFGWTSLGFEIGYFY